MFLYILEGRIHISIHFSGKDTYFCTFQWEGCIFLYNLVGRMHNFTHFSRKDTYFIHFSGKDAYFCTSQWKECVFSHILVERKFLNILRKSIHASFKHFTGILHRFVHLMGKLTLIYIFYIRGELQPSYVSWGNLHSFIFLNQRRVTPLMHFMGKLTLIYIFKLEESNTPHTFHGETYTHLYF